MVRWSIVSLRVPSARSPWLFCGDFAQLPSSTQHLPCPTGSQLLCAVGFAVARRSPSGSYLRSASIYVLFSRCEACLHALMCYWCLNICLSVLREEVERHSSPDKPGLCRGAGLRSWRGCRQHRSQHAHQHVHNINVAKPYSISVFSRLFASFTFVSMSAFSPHFLARTQIWICHFRT